MAATEILRSYLIKLGYELDQSSLQKFNDSLAQSAKLVTEFAAGEQWQPHRPEIIRTDRVEYDVWGAVGINVRILGRDDRAVHFVSTGRNRVRRGD